MRTVILAFTLAALTTCSPPADAQESNAQTPVIVVSGSAVVRRAPDVAFVTVAVETRAKGPRDAQRQNGDAMNAVVARIGALGIPKDAIRTVGLQLDQEYDMPNGRRVPRDFVARNALEVRADDIEKAGEVADAAVGAGATSISGIRFDLKDRAGAEREAIRRAVADARGRADAAAAGAGRAVDRIIKIEAGATNFPPPRPMMAMRTAEAATVVEPGMIEIRSDVTLTVAMR